VANFENSGTGAGAKVKGVVLKKGREKASSEKARCGHLLINQGGYGTTARAQVWEQSLFAGAEGDRGSRGKKREEGWMRREKRTCKEEEKK